VGSQKLLEGINIFIVDMLNFIFFEIVLFSHVKMEYRQD